jgi:hypothetical protein
MKRLIPLLIIVWSLTAFSNEPKVTEKKELKITEYIQMEDWLKTHQNHYENLMQDMILEIRQLYSSPKIIQLIKTAVNIGKSESDISELSRKLNDPFILKIHKLIYSALTQAEKKYFITYKERDKNFETERLKVINEIDGLIFYSNMSYQIDKYYNRKLMKIGVNNKRKDFVKELYFKTNKLKLVELKEYLRRLKAKMYGSLFADINATYVNYIVKINITIKNSST